MNIDVHHHWMPGELYYNVGKYLRPGQEVVQEGQRAIVEGLPDEALRARVLGENAARPFRVP